MTIQRNNTPMMSLLAPRLRKNRGEAYWLPIHVGQPGPIIAAREPVILATTGAAALVITLQPVTSQLAKVYAIKKIDAGVGTVDITPTVPDLIDGAPVYQLAVQYEGIIIVCEPGGWWILSQI